MNPESPQEVISRRKGEDIEKFSSENARQRAAAYSGKYADILQCSRPVSKKHLPMPVADRAKQFSAFAALKGHMETLRTKEKIVVPKIELSEDMKEILDERLRILEVMLRGGAHPIVTVTYFHPDKFSPDHEGEYRQKTGMTARLDLTARLIQIVDTKILFEDIREIQGEIF